MPVDIRINYSDYDATGKPFGKDGLSAVMGKYNTEIGVLVPGLAVECDFVRGGEELYEMIKDDDRLYGYLVVNPHYPDESVELMRRLMNSPKFLGAALFTGSTSPYPNADDYDVILNAYRRFGKPVLIETVNAEAVEAAEGIAVAFPGIKFILGSMGGDDWKAAVRVAEKRLNMLLETSGSYDSEKIEEAVEKVGAHRMMFGSGLPSSDPASMLALVKGSGISEDSMAKILGQTARRLFEL
jgi:uncharacterized protein